MEASDEAGRVGRRVGLAEADRAVLLSVDVVGDELIEFRHQSRARMYLCSNCMNQINETVSFFFSFFLLRKFCTT